MNYIGSKHSLSDFLLSSIDEVTGTKNSDYTGKVVCDGFAGTGAVSKLFKEHGAKVISNDIQYYSYILLKHILENIEADDMDETKFNYLNDLDLITNGFIYNNYCLGSGSTRQCFSDENGKKCDTIRYEIQRLYDSNEINEHEYYWYLASLLEDIDKTANTASVYAAYLKHLKKSAQKPMNFIPMDIVRGKRGEALIGDINENIKNIKSDILYLDPPYNSRQYCAYYHILETIALLDNPVIHGKTGMRDYSNQKSNWCIKNQVCEVFDDLLSEDNSGFVFLSYNNEGLMNIEQVKDIMSKYGTYELKTKKYHRFKADRDENRTHKASETEEYLHCLIRK